MGKLACPVVPPGWRTRARILAAVAVLSFVSCGIRSGDRPWYVELAGKEYTGELRESHGAASCGCRGRGDLVRQRTVAVRAIAEIDPAEAIAIRWIGFVPKRLDGISFGRRTSKRAVSTESSNNSRQNAEVLSAHYRQRDENRRSATLTRDGRVGRHLILRSDQVPLMDQPRQRGRCTPRRQVHRAIGRNPRCPHRPWPFLARGSS